VSRGGDSGTPVVLSDPGSKVAEIFLGLATQIASTLAVRNAPVPGAGKRSSKLTLIR
jgi:hypothetical protein